MCKAPLRAPRSQLRAPICALPTARCPNAISSPRTGTRLAHREGGGVFVKPVRSLAGVAALLFLMSCGSGRGIVGGSSVSLDEEWQLGNQMAAQVAQQVHIVNDPQALADPADVRE